MITSGICRSFKAEVLRGIHVLQTDIIKVALYTSAAAIGPQTTAYTTTGEATGTNWAAGGQPLVAADDYPQLDPTGFLGVMKWDDLEVANVTVTFRGLLLYNSSKANRAIAVLDRGIDVIVTNGQLTIGFNPVQPYVVFIA